MPGISVEGNGSVVLQPAYDTPYLSCPSLCLLFYVAQATAPSYPTLCPSSSRVVLLQAELIRTTCAVLVRRVVVPSGPHWSRLDAATKAALRAGLLSAIGNETSNPVARKVCLNGTREKSTNKRHVLAPSMKCTPCMYIEPVAPVV